MKQWKKVIALGLCACMLGSTTITSVQTNAEETVADENMTSITLEDGTVIEYDANEFTINEKGVLTAYKGTDTKVVIPDGVTSIGRFTLYAVTSVTLPDSVTSIQNWAFGEESRLDEVRGYTGSYAHYYALFNGYVFTSLGQSENSIEPFVIEDGILTKYQGVDTEVVIPNSVTSIGEDALNGCIWVTSINIPDSVTSIEEDAFRGCKSLTSINIPNSVTSIKGYAFSKCTALTSINIPDSVTSIGYNTFEGCTALTSINISNSVTSIGSSAFRQCTALTDITIPDSVTSIKYDAFEGCTNLKEVKGYTGSIAECIPYRLGINFISLGQTKNPVEEFVTNDDGRLIGYNGTSADIVIPSNINDIVFGVFDDIKGLRSVTVPDGVDFRGMNVLFNYHDGTFGGCDNLTTIKGYTGSGMERIAYELGINYVSLGQSKEEPREEFEIVDGVLRHYNGVSPNVFIPASVTSIGGNAFYACEGLKSVTIPNTVTNIEDGAFEGCTGLISIVLPNGVTNIGNRAFYYTSLTSITIPDGVTNIGNYAFYYTGLTKITIPASVTSIGYYAFTDLEEVKGYTGSYAETWAKENGYTFVAIDAVNPTPTPPSTNPTETPTPSETVAPTETTKPTETVKPSESEQPTPSETVKPSETPDVSGGAVQTDPNIDPITGKEYGDADMDGKILLKDAQLTLKVALGIEQVSDDVIRIMSGGGDKVVLKNAQKILKMALGIDKTYHDVEK